MIVDTLERGGISCAFKFGCPKFNQLSMNCMRVADAIRSSHMTAKHELKAVRNTDANRTPDTMRPDEHDVSDSCLATMSPISTCYNSACTPQAKSAIFIP